MPTIISAKKFGGPPPSTAATPAVHFEASDSVRGATGVTSWTDRAAGVTVTPTVGTPTYDASFANGRPAVFLNGATMGGTFGTPIDQPQNGVTVFWVGQVAVDDETMYFMDLWDGADDDPRIILQRYAAVTNYEFGIQYRSDTWSGGRGGELRTTPALITASVLDDGTISLRRNAVDEPITTSSSAGIGLTGTYNRILLGGTLTGSEVWLGRFRIAELQVYTSALGTGARDAVESELMTKYGLA